MSRVKRHRSQKTIAHHTELANSVAHNNQRPSTQAPIVSSGASASLQPARCLTVEMNPKFFDALKAYQFNGIKLQPYPENSDLWFMRVILPDKRAVLCFPADGTYYIGLQTENHRNPYVQYTWPSKEIHVRISSNGRKAILSVEERDCLEAIEFLQKAITLWHRVSALHPKNLQELAMFLGQDWLDLNPQRLIRVISGALAKEGYSRGQVENVFRSTCAMNGDIDLKDRMADVNWAFDRFERGKSLPGLDSLQAEGLLSAENIKQIAAFISKEA